MEKITSRHIGIVAGSAEGAAHCYRTICIEGARLLGPHAHPEVSMHSHPLARYMNCIYQDDWAGVGDLMLISARKLAGSGAEFLICPDNTFHEALPLIASRSPLPWLHIAEVVAEEAAVRGFHRLGFARYALARRERDLSRKACAAPARILAPGPDEREELNRIIMEELVYGVFKPEAVAYHQRLIERMKDEGCDAVILGCTEIPLIISDDNSLLATLDSTRLLARAALARAVR